jgi:uncharacterized protein YecE (DUF72 family)
MGDRMRIRVGLAGWTNPPVKRLERRVGQTHLAYYAAHFSCVEINSSFYRPHRRATYQRWRDETDPQFRFSVKMPRSVTHESHLKRCAAEVARFYEDVAALQPKLAAVLVQLPPSLEFNGRAARCPGAETPGGGARRFAYFRWHGSPRLYYSKYSEAQLAAFAALVWSTQATDTWCIFDNTAAHAAWENALEFERTAFAAGGESDKRTSVRCG